MNGLDLADPRAESRVGLHPRGDVADNAHAMPAALDLDGGQRERDRDLHAVFSERPHLVRLAQGGPLARTLERGEGGAVRLAVRWRRDELMQRLAECLGARVPEYPRGCRVPIRHPAFRIHQQDCVLGGIGDGRQPGIALPQSEFGLRALDHLDLELPVGTSQFDRLPFEPRMQAVPVPV